MADPAQHKRETATGLADQWRHDGAICFCVSASCVTAGACTPFRTVPPSLQSFPASQPTACPGRLDHRPDHAVRSTGDRQVTAVLIMPRLALRSARRRIPPAAAATAAVAAPPLPSAGVGAGASSASMVIGPAAAPHRAAAARCATAAPPRAREVIHVLQFVVFELFRGRGRPQRNATQLRCSPKTRSAQLKSPLRVLLKEHPLLESAKFVPPSHRQPRQLYSAARSDTPSTPSGTTRTASSGRCKGDVVSVFL